MKRLAIATMLASFIGLTGCTEDVSEKFPDTARIPVRYSPEVSALWNEMYPPINLRGGEHFKYVVFDEHTENCPEYVSIDGVLVYKFFESLPARCGTQSGPYFSVMITYTNGGGYRVYVPEENLYSLTIHPNKFNEGHYDEFLSQFMTTTPIGRCNSEIKNLNECDKYIQKGQLAINFYPQKAKDMQSLLHRQDAQKMARELANAMRVK